MHNIQSKSLNKNHFNKQESTIDFLLLYSEPLTSTAVIYFTFDDQVSNDGYITLDSGNISVEANSSTIWALNITGKSAGHVILGINSSSTQILKQVLV